MPENAGDSRPGDEMSPEQKLPALREDLHLLRGPRNWRGEPTWRVHDPVGNRFVQLGERDYYLLIAWNEAIAGRIVARAETISGAEFSLSELKSLFDFLVQQELVAAATPALRGRLSQVHDQRQSTLLKRLLHQYLFIRIPLVRPDKFLDAIYPHIKLFLQPWFLILSLITGICGLFFIIKDWSLFIQSFSYLYSLSGLIIFTATLAVVKILHELGHAMMCKHYGLRVPTMGVAFLVMWPVLYTDATDSWRLASRRKRASIAAAGVATEMLLACYAMLAWVILPDGLARSIALIVATTAWITSLAVNSNPLMRFDGYYFLSDWLNVPNLQDRSIAIAKWRLRNALFSMRQLCPEDFSPAMLRGLTVYAWALVIYRFFLFLGIALLVYHFFFKALGVVLFIVEIWWFIAKPIISEVRQWGGFMHVLPVRRKVQGMLLVGAGLFLLLFPWKGSVEVPAVLSGEPLSRIYSGQPGQVSSILVKDGDFVEKGDLLARLHSPFLEQRLALAVHEVKRLSALRAQTDTSSELISERLIVEQRLVQAQSARQAIEQAMEQLDIHAPFSGEVVDINEEVHVGRWVSSGERIMTLVGFDDYVITGWISEKETPYAREGDIAKFYAEVSQGYQALPAQLVRIDNSVVSELSMPYQAAVFGGRVPVAASEAGGALHPSKAVFRVAATASPLGSKKTGWTGQQRGVLVVAGQRRSLLESLWVWLAAAFIRETGF